MGDLKLLPCDCGRKRIALESYIVEDWNDGNFYGIADRYFYTCPRCGCSSPSATTPAEAKRAWNKMIEKKVVMPNDAKLSGRMDCDESDLYDTWPL